MGYRPQRKVYTLVFEGEHEGLEVKARAVPLGTFMEITGLRDAAATDKVDAVVALFEQFAKALVSWNIELPDDPADEDGPWSPVSADLAGLQQLDPDLAMVVIETWADVVGGMNGPLGNGSKTGSGVAASIPMEALTASPPSSPGPS